MVDRNLYNTILCLTYSPCGKYLLAGNVYGQLAVFDLEKILDPPCEVQLEDLTRPRYKHTINEDFQLCSMVTSKSFLIVGTFGEITGWDWKAILSSKKIKPSWAIQVPAKKSALEQVDINSLWLSEDEERLYAGCGDNNVYCYHLEDGKLIRTFEGHEDFVHCISGKGNQISSASEDGTVKLWDPRSSQVSNTICPHKNDKLTRPDLGKWVGAVAVTDDWIVCGGGPRLALWHLRSLDSVCAFPWDDRGIHTAAFHDYTILAGGAHPYLYQVRYSGEVLVQLEVSMGCVYAAAVRPPAPGAAAPQPAALAVAGSSARLDLCSTLNYRDQILHFE